MFHLLGQVKVLPFFAIMGNWYTDFVKPNFAGSPIAQNALSYAYNNDGNVIMDWFYPQDKERRQLGTQIAMDMIQPSIDMKAMQDAGINPLTAAAGIAGSSSNPVPQPASSVNPLGDVAGAVGSAATAFQSASGGISTLGKLIPEIGEINSNTKKNLAAAGLDEVNSEAVMTDNKYRGENWEAELNVKRQQFKNMQQELTNMKASHREIMSHCDEMISQIELNGSQKDYYDAMQLKIQEDLRWQKSLNDWCLNHNLMIRDSGVDGYIFNMLYNESPDGDVSAFFNAYYDYCKNRSYASTRGLRDAEIDTAFDKAFNEALGNADVQAKFASYFGDVEVLKDTLKELYKGLVENPGNPFNFVGKVLNLIYQGASGVSLPKDVTHNPWSQPIVSPKSSN